MLCLLSDVSRFTFFIVKYLYFYGVFNFIYVAFYDVMYVIFILHHFYIAMLYGSEAWCLKERQMEILRRTERSTVRAMCGVRLKDRKRFTDLMFMLGLNDTIDQLTMTNSVHWYGHVLRRERVVMS